MATIGNPWRMLNTVRTINGSATQTFADPFVDVPMSATEWSHPGWTVDGVASTGLPSVLSNRAFLVGGSLDSEVRSAVLVDKTPTTEGYREVAALNWYGQITTSLFLMMDMNDGAPVPTGGIRLRVTIGTPGSLAWALRLYIDDEEVAVKTFASQPPATGTIAGTFITRMVVDASNTIKVYWSSNFAPDITYSPGAYTPSGGRVGFALRRLDASKQIYVDAFNFYYSTSAGQLPPIALVGSNNGLIYYESTNGNMIQVDSATTTLTDEWIASASRLDKLYVADHGVKAENATGTAETTAGPSSSTLSDPDADFVAALVNNLDDIVEITGGGATIITGTYPIESVGSATLLGLAGTTGVGLITGVTYRIVRAPKVFDATALTFTRFTATAGSVPPNCTIVAVFNDRLCWAGDDLVPEAIYMSKVGAPTDYDYGTNLADEAFVYDPARVSGAPYIGDRITALIPHLDDYLVIGAERSIWIQRGDPALGAGPEAISREIGILKQSAWCYTPEGAIVAMTLDGLYLINPGAGPPQRLSRDRMPQELVNIDISQNDVLVEYDTLRNGINIFVTPRIAGPTRHFWFGWNMQEFSPESYRSDFEPTAITSHSLGGVGPRRVILGCRDGYLRVHENAAYTDDGENFQSNVLVGPIMLGGGGYYEGMIREVVGQLAEDSGAVTMKIRTGDSIESAYNASSRVSYVMRAGKNRTWRPNLRGNACFIELSSEGGQAWAFEQLSIVRERLGKQRLLA